MARQIFTYIVHRNGKLEDSATELAAAAKKIDAGASVTAIVTGSGVDALCSQVAPAYKQIWKVDNAVLNYPNAEVIRRILVKIIPKDAVVLIPHDTFGMDLGPGLSIKLDVPFISDVVGIDGVEGNNIKVVRQEFGGMASTHVAADISKGAVISCRPGSFKPEENPAAGGQVVDKTGEAGTISETTRKFIKVVEAEKGDVDITKSEVLVSVGRGIEDQENLGIVFDLAKIMGADVSCTRPIIDAKWLEKSRQVGTSGLTVKPKVYIALGISGSFQHMGGIKGSPYIVAINKNLKAPIFQFSDVGVVANILEFVPEFTEAVKEKK